MQLVLRLVLLPNHHLAGETVIRLLQVHCWVRVRHWQQVTPQQTNPPQTHQRLYSLEKQLARWLGQQRQLEHLQNKLLLRVED